MNLKIKDNQKEFNSARTNKKLLQVERGEIFYREDIKYTFAYALIGLTAVIAVTGLVVGIGGMGYSFIQQMKK